MCRFICWIIMSALLGNSNEFLLQSETFLEDRGTIFNYTYKGCYSNSRNETEIYMQIQPNTTKSERYFKGCFRHGFHFVSLNDGIKLCCDLSIIQHFKKVDNSMCPHCPGEPTIRCGKHQEHAIYELKKITSENVGLQDIKMSEEEPIILLAGSDQIVAYKRTYDSTDPIRKRSQPWTLVTVVKLDGHIDAIDYHLLRKEGYAIWNSSLYRFPLFNDQVVLEHEVEHITDVTRCLTFAVDWKHEKIYLPDCHDHYISAINLHTRNNERDIVIHLHDEGAWAMDMEIDPYKGLLFWTTGASLWSCRLDGKHLRKIVPAFPVNRVAALFLDIATERVYFTGLDKRDKNSTQLFYAEYDGSLSHALHYSDFEEGNNILSFGIFTPHVYYIQKDQNNSLAVFASKVDYNQKSTIIVDIAELELKHLRLVHPKLQTPSKEDVCTHRGCSHMCLVEGGEPWCLCFPDYEVEEDGTSCGFVRMEDELPLLLRIVLGLMFVLLVLLSAGVLMCLTDKIWSQLHPTVVSLSMPGTARRTLNGQVMEDGANLI